MSLWLSADELIELTGKRHRDKQIEALLVMGIPFRKRPDGFVLVLRDAVVPKPAKPARREPNFEVA